MQDIRQKQIDALKTAPKIKIQAEWTQDAYTHQDARGHIQEVGVDGWLVRLNGIKFPRPQLDDEGGWDWSWRYTPKGGQSEEAKHKAITEAMREAKLPWSHLQTA